MRADAPARRAREEIELAARIYVRAGPRWDRDGAMGALHAARLFYEEADKHLAEACEEARKNVTPDPEHERAMGRL